MENFISKFLILGAPGVAQWVEHLTPDFGSGDDLRVLRFRSASGSGCALSMEPAWDSPSASLPFPQLVCALKF